MGELKILSSPGSVSMAEEWFEYVNDDHFWLRWRFDVLIGEFERLGIPSLVGKRILDIGGGRGDFAKRLEDRFQLSVDMADLNLRMLNEGRNSGDRFFYNIFDLNPEMIGHYDMVMLFDVIEHVENDLGIVESAMAHLKPGGLMLINVPALSVAYSAYDRMLGHCRRYDKRTLRSLLERLGGGASVLSVRYWGMTLLPMLFARKVWLTFIDTQRIVAVGFQPPNTFVNQFFIQLSKAENATFRDPILGTSLMAIVEKR